MCRAGHAKNWKCGQPVALQAAGRRQNVPKCAISLTPCKFEITRETKIVRATRTPGEALIWSSRKVALPCSQNDRRRLRASGAFPRRIHFPPPHWPRARRGTSSCIQDTRFARSLVARGRIRILCRIFPRLFSLVARAGEPECGRSRNGRQHAPVTRSRENRRRRHPPRPADLIGRGSRETSELSKRSIVACARRSAPSAGAVGCVCWML